ncbi:MAG: Myo-inositol 2-dehydrogenase [Verrucomicrobiae bacterium]|nr:Myo-inositol 2-dehydrogenase [Verrucomicrobiae bacterium]
MSRKSTPARPLRIGLVGCGRISRAHVAGYRQAGGARIVRVFDANPTAAAALAQETGAAVADSLAALAQPAEVDAVSICTPPAFHLEHGRLFVRAGIPVLCEKPLAANLADAQKLAALVGRRRALFMAGFCHRFHPPIRALRELLRRGRLGKPLVFRVTFAGQFPLTGDHRANARLAGGGCLADNGAHAVDLFRFLIGEVATVQAQTGHLVQPAAVEDYAALLWRGRDGCVGEFVTGYSFPQAENTVTIWCANGVVTVNYGVPNRPELVYQLAGETTEHVVNVKSTPDRFTTEVKHFLDCVRTGNQPSVTAADGLAAVKIITAAYRAAQTGRAVKLR